MADLSNISLQLTVGDWPRRGALNSMQYSRRGARGVTIIKQAPSIKVWLVIDLSQIKKTSYLSSSIKAY